MADFARSWSHDGVHLTAAEWKIIICSYFEAALAEADGREVQDISLPESSSQMDVSRMDNMLEYCCFLGAQLGIELSH
jgi:hypothetical protein